MAPKSTLPNAPLPEFNQTLVERDELTQQQYQALSILKEDLPTNEFDRVFDATLRLRRVTITLLPRKAMRVHLERGYADVTIPLLDVDDGELLDRLQQTTEDYMRPRLDEFFASPTTRASTDRRAMSNLEGMP